MKDTKHTKQAFASITGIKTKDLATYIRRGKVIAEGNEIDLSNPVNIAFLEHRQKLLGGRKPEKEESQNPIEEASKPMDSAGISAVISQGTSLSEIEKQKKIADLEKVLHEIELLSIKKQKALGEVIPTHLAKDITRRLAASLINSYKDALEELLIEINHRHRLKGSELAEYRGKVVLLINKAHDTGVTIAEKDIVNSASSYAEVRGKGEKK